MEYTELYVRKIVLMACLLIPSVCLWGVVAYLIHRIRKGRSKLAMAGCGVVGVLAVLSLLFGIGLYVSIVRAKREAAFSQADRHVVAIGKGLKEYAQSHEGKFPPKETWAETLIEEDVVAKDDFSISLWIGGRERPVPAGVQDFRYAGKVRFMTEEPDHVLVWTIPLNVSGIPDFEETKLEDKRRLVIYSNTIVDIVPESQFDEMRPLN